MPSSAILRASARHLLLQSSITSSSSSSSSRALFSSTRKFAPLGDRVLIRRSIKETITSGGILLPSDNVKESNEGTVVSVGPGMRDVSGNLHPLNLKVGDGVLLPKYGGTEVDIGDEKMSLYREEDILGKFE